MRAIEFHKDMQLKFKIAMTYSGGEKLAGFELLQTHGDSVGAKEEDKGHQGDVWNILAALSNELPTILNTLLL